jgi:hypothetical protein
MRARKPHGLLLLTCVLGASALLSGSASAQIRPSIPSWGLVTYFYDVGSVPGLDYDAVISDQPIDLDGVSFFAIGESDDLCYVVPALQNGLMYTLVSTTGGLSGRLSDVNGVPFEDGDVLSNVRPDGRSCMHTIGSLEFHYHESGPLQTVTATVVDGSPIPVTTTHIAAPRRSVETNQPVTLTARVRPSSGGVAGTVSFSDEAAGSTVCANVPVELVDGSWTATCKAAFRPPHEEGEFMWSGNVRATFTPADATALVDSATTHWLTVRAGRTSTSVQVERTATGQMLATATVVPTYKGPYAPTGAVAFSDAGTLIPGCEAQPLGGSAPAQATCDLSALATDGHEIVASYLGDDAFDGSQSSPQALTVEPPIEPPAAQPPAAGASAGSTAKPAPSHRRGAVRRSRCRHRERRHARAGAHRSRPHRCAHIRRHRSTARRVARRLRSSAGAPAA